MPHLRLTYFDAPGRAEPIRQALRLNGIDFEDRRLKHPDFRALKDAGELPLGQVPMLEVDGRKFVQTAAILRYVAALGDGSLQPKDAPSALVVDSVLDTFNDTLSQAMRPSFREPDLDKKIAMRRELATGAMGLACRYAEDLIEGPFLLGERLTVADLVLAGHVFQIESGRLDGLTMDDLAPYPKLLALARAVKDRVHG